MASSALLRCCRFQNRGILGATSDSANLPVQTLVCLHSRHWAPKPLCKPLNSVLPRSSGIMGWAGASRVSWVLQPKATSKPRPSVAAGAGASSAVAAAVGSALPTRPRLGEARSLHWLLGNGQGGQGNKMSGGLDISTCMSSLQEQLARTRMCSLHEQDVRWTCHQHLHVQPARAACTNPHVQPA